MISVHWYNPTISGASEEELQRVAKFDPIRRADILSLRMFMEAQKRFLTGRVLDFGAGKPGTCREPQPYRDLVSGEYLPFDIGDTMPDPPFDTIMCNQVLQYLSRPSMQVITFANWLRPGGKLVLTYATNWDEVENEDRWRFTKFGMNTLLARAGFDIEIHERRAEVKLGAFTFPIGYGVVCSKRW